MKPTVPQVFRPHARALVLCAALCCLSAAAPTRAQSGADSYDKQRGRMMLDQIKQDIKSNYYDPTYHGTDLDATFKAAEEKLKSAQSSGQILGIIAAAVLSLNDSHTFFLPPQRQAITDYGWEMQAIGDAVYVSRVKEKSDAEAKGLKVGDTVLLVDGYQPARENLRKLAYLYYVLRPQPGMHVAVQSPGGQPREFDILAKVVDRKRMDLTQYSEFMNLVRESESGERERKRSHQVQEFGEDLFVWKMPRFNLEPAEVDGLIDRAAKSKALVIDLRGNPGGYELTLLRLIGNLFDRDVKVGDIVRRKETKQLVAKSRGAQAYKGKVIVLVDSRSGSSAEILARVLQLEKRGTVIGDRTAGAVMRARHYSHEVGLDTVTFYAASVTDADLKMSDGKSLEGTGVTPDEIKLLSGADLAAKSDPVLAYAAKLAGVTIDPAKAGTLFPELKTKN